MKKLFRFIINPIWAQVLFWSWNTIFLAFVMLGFLPLILIELFRGMSAGWITWQFVMFGSVMVAIPLIAVAIAFFVLRFNASNLLAFGYGVEGPLMIVLLVRFFALREVMPTVALILISAVIGLLALLWQILDGRIDTRGPLSQVIRLTGMTLLVLVGVYISVWLAFYVPPVLMGVINLVRQALINLPEVFLRGRIPTLEALAYIPFMALGFLLMVYSGTLFVGMPIVAPLIYARAWWRSLKAAKQHLGLAPTLALPAAIAIAGAFAFVQTNQQPQQQAFALLDKKISNASDIAALKSQEEAIRMGLLNAYLAPQRYISAVGEVTHVREMYKWALNMNDEQAGAVQRAYEAVASPILYVPSQPVTDTNIANQWEQVSFTSDAKRASELYQQYFDKPINKAERDTIVAAMRANWDVNRVTEAWQAVDEREVLITRQELNITEHEGYADAELYEVYQNQTQIRQEVVYYFSLPESAVVTGLWLGNSAKRDERFVYRVSPRGAAQQLYRNEVRVQRDPALIEQIGPRQYRLRVFPIEPSSWRWDDQTRRSTLQAPPQMHVWLTWRMLPENGQYSLPRLSEKRNAYWTPDSVRLVNGQPRTNGFDEGVGAWLPANFSASKAAITTAKRFDFANGQSVLMQPIGQQLASQNMNIAIVLDRSRSMADQAEAIKATLIQVRERFSENTDVYLTSADTRGEAPSRTKLSTISPEQIVYFGGQDPADLLAQFATLQNHDHYDAIVVLTDSGGDALLGKDGRAVPVLDAPVWMVHLGGLPLGYDDKLLDAILASGGNIATNLDEVLARTAVRAQEGEVVDVSGGYLWRTLPTAQAQQDTAAQAVASDDPLAAFAARRLILAEVQRNRGKIGEASALDQLHKIAIAQSIISPYSSMIVLVNDAQQKALDELEKKGDRFERELETVGETNNGGQPVVTGVPEPHEWALIALAAVMLVVYYKRRRVRMNGI